MVKVQDASFSVVVAIAVNPTFFSSFFFFFLFVNNNYFTSHLNSLGIHCTKIGTNDPNERALIEE
jgi:hypothetical protein